MLTEVIPPKSKTTANRSGVKEEIYSATNERKVKKIMNNNIKQMTLEELRKERDRLEPISPMLSEGNISPFQVSRMGKQERREWEANVSLRWRIQTRINYLERPIEERIAENREAEISNLTSLIGVRKRTIDYFKALPSSQSKRMNHTKRSIIETEQEIKLMESEIKELQKC